MEKNPSVSSVLVENTMKVVKSLNKIQSSQSLVHAQEARQNFGTLEKQLSKGHESVKDLESGGSLKSESKVKHSEASEREIIPVESVKTTNGLGHVSSSISSNTGTESLSTIIKPGYLTRASVEHTLAMIKPEGMVHERKIILRFKKEGFIILARRRVHLTPEQVSDFYHDLYGRRDFPLLVATTSSAPVAVFCLGRPKAVEKLKEVVGPCDVDLAKKESPECLNAQFGNPDCNFPAVHASCDSVNARREIQFFFPVGTIEKVKKVMEGLEFLEKEVTPLLKEGLSQLLKVKPVEPKLWLAGWLLENNSRGPKVAEHLRYQL